MIVLFTDYGLAGPYLGQVQSVLHQTAPGVPVINLLADAPAHDPKPSAYLLAALAGEFPEGSVFLAVQRILSKDDEGDGEELATYLVNWFRQ